MKPALATAGVPGGIAGVGIFVTMIVNELTTNGFTNWKTLLAYLAALFVSAVWAWWTAKSPSVVTGIQYFDKGNPTE